MFPSDLHQHDDTQDGWLYTILFPWPLALVAAKAAGPLIYLDFRSSGPVDVFRVCVSLSWKPVIAGPG